MQRPQDPISQLSWLFLLIWVLVGLGCSSETTTAQDDVTPILSETDRELVTRLEQVSFSIRATPLEIDDGDLTILDNLANTRIVGLGEATHGTREFFEMKFRIFRYLVEQHGFKAFVFEMDFGEAMIFNDWVQGNRDDDIEKLMFEKMIFWTWRTQEVKELLEWMRAYNISKDPEDQIGIYGVDVQFADYNLDHLVSLLKHADVPSVDSLAMLNIKFKNINSLFTEFYSDKLRTEIRMGIDFARSIVEENKNQIINKLGMDSFLWADQLAVHMQQVEAVIYNKSQLGEYHLRDKYMAENTSWFFEILGRDAQLVLWAHNAHIADDFDFAGFKGGSQGNYLKQTYGDQYQTIGFSFAQGQFTAVQTNGPLKTHSISSTPQSNSTNYLFFYSKYDQFIVPTQSDDPTLDWWFEYPRPFLQIGSTYNGSPSYYYREANVHMLYDYLIHFDNTSNSRLIR